MFIDVREPHTNWLLFRYDPARELVEIQRRGERTLIDLTQYQAHEAPRGSLSVTINSSSGIGEINLVQAGT